MVRDDVIRFHDTKKKNTIVDPDKRWIRTWNDYFQRIKYFMRWLHNGAPESASPDSTIASADWLTPNFVQIRPKKTNRLSPYSESEIWDLDDLLSIIRYEPIRRNKGALLGMLFPMRSFYLSSMFMMLEKLKDQKDINIVASTLYRSGQLKVRQ